MLRAKHVYKRTSGRVELLQLNFEISISENVFAVVNQRIKESKCRMTLSVNKNENFIDDCGSLAN